MPTPAVIPNRFATRLKIIVNALVTDADQVVSLILRKIGATNQGICVTFPCRDPTIFCQNTSHHVLHDLRVILDLSWIVRKNGLGYIFRFAGAAFFEKFLDHYRLVDMRLTHLLGQERLEAFVGSHSGLGVTVPHASS